MGSEIKKRIRAEERAEDILTLLAAKGAVLPEVKEAIYAQTDTEVLKGWLLLAAGTASVEEFARDMRSGGFRCQNAAEQAAP